MLSYLQAIIMGGLQGVTELFPISSLGHSVILPSLLNWHIDQSDPSFLLFLVLTHLATAIVLFGFFFKDWMRIIAGIIRSLRQRAIDEADSYAKLGWLIVIGNVPVGILGLLFEERLKTLFAAPAIAATFLVCNGVVLYVADRLRAQKPEMPEHDSQTDNLDARVAHLSWRQSIWIGAAQCLALIPGFSRTGLTLSAGLGNGLTHAEAARYSFLLATPIIAAASILKLPELFGAISQGYIGPLIAGIISSGIMAYVAAKFLTSYFKTKKLKPFAIYCVLAGIGSLLVLSF